MRNKQTSSPHGSASKQRPNRRPLIQIDALFKLNKFPREVQDDLGDVEEGVDLDLRGVECIVEPNVQGSGGIEMTSLQDHAYFQ